MRQFADTLLHRQRHLNTREGVLLNTEGGWIAKEQYNGITNVLVDCCTVLQRNFRHFGQVMVEQLREILRLHFVSNLGESNQIGEADRKLLAFADDLNLLLAREDRIINLRRQIFRKLS